MIAEQLHMEKEVIRVWFCNRRQKEKRINPCSAAPMLPSPGKPASYSPHLVPEPLGWGRGTKLCHLLAPQQALCVKHDLPGDPQCLEQKQGESPLWTGCHMGGALSPRDTEFPGGCGLT